MNVFIQYGVGRCGARHREVRLNWVCDSAARRHAEKGCVHTAGAIERSEELFKRDGSIPVEVDGADNLLGLHTRRKSIYTHTGRKSKPFRDMHFLCGSRRRR